MIFSVTRRGLPSAQLIDQGSIHTGSNARAKGPPGMASRDFAAVLVQTSAPVGRFSILSITSMK
jgi:hypothetical protein